MHNITSHSILMFVILCSVLILLLVSYITWITYGYQQKQNAYYRRMEEIKAAHENILLQSQVEMQEKTFQDISREIHDNIGQKLSMAKLLLNTLKYDSMEELSRQVEDSVNILSQAVNELSNVSRSMSSEIIVENGIMKATEAELIQIKKTAKYDINFEVSGDSIFLDVNRELVLFRVIQECLHNIIKHAKASAIDVRLHYGAQLLNLQISDNGKGFSMEKSHMGTGIKNMQKRIQLLSGTYTMHSSRNKGTKIEIEIPFI